MAMTNYLRKKLGDHAIGKASFSMPAAVYLGLFTASPGVSGSLAAEAGGGSYARVSITSLLGAFDLTTGIAVSVSDINFAAPTGNWGTVTYVGVLDQATGTSPDVTNMLFFDPLPTPRIVVSGGRRVQFLAGSFSISL